MNKRIQELKANTLDKHFSYTWTTMDYDDVSKFAEKFAELIVQECASICDAYGMPDGTSPTAMILSRAIKKHFQVEE